MKTRKADRCYAMKVATDRYLREKNHQFLCAADMLGREAEIVRSIRHLGIPGWVDFFGRDEMYCLAQEYVPGDTLAGLINQGRRFREEEVRTITLELLKILHFLHTPDTNRPAIIHRDLRLSNLIVENNALFLIDFGLAYRVKNDADELFLTKLWTAQRGAAASSSYTDMRGGLSVQSDLFGAGVVAVDLFTNSADSDAAKPWERRIQVSPPFKTFIRRLLGVEGSFASAIEALDHLQGL